MAFSSLSSSQRWSVHCSLVIADVTLSAVAAIALAPSSAPNSLFVNLLQANAYAISLLYYLLNDSASLDWFHVAYACVVCQFGSVCDADTIASSLMLALSVSNLHYGIVKRDSS